jgi:hypothetical protein
MISKIKDKGRRHQKNQDICQDPAAFIEEDKNDELRKIARRLARLARFPVTQYSQDYLADLELFSQRYYMETGEIPLVFTDNSIEPELAMMILGDQRSQMVVLMGEDRPVEPRRSNLIERIGKEHGFRFSYDLNYFPEMTLNGLLKYCYRFKPRVRGDFGDSGNESENQSLTRFLAALVLNSFAKDLQQKMHLALKPNIPNLEKLIEKHRAATYYQATGEYKQRRRIDNLIARKQIIEEERIPVVGTGEIDWIALVPQLRQFIY